jgi:hypothetical protein
MFCSRSREISDRGPLEPRILTNRLLKWRSERMAVRWVDTGTLREIIPIEVASDKLKPAHTETSSDCRSSAASHDDQSADDHRTADHLVELKRFAPP